MKYIGIVIVLSLIFLGCELKDASQEEVLKASEGKVWELEKEMSMVQPRGRILRHDVYFDLKDDLTDGDRSRFETGLRSLSSIKEARRGLRVGKGADTGDQRLVSDYDFVLSMYFEKLGDLEKYAKDSFHLKVREEVGPLLEKTPVVYDSWIE